MISLIVAAAHNNIIGKSNGLPWYLPADLRHFKEVTIGHPVIMGRKTFDSILARLGKPLPNRTNIIVTRDHGFVAEGVIVVHSLEEAYKHAKDQEVFVIGGAQIYEQALPVADRIYLTEVDADINGDTYFPIITGDWVEVSREAHNQDEKNPYNYAFVVLEKVS
jgi:dihydrofolate reductase